MLYMEHTTCWDLANVPYMGYWPRPERVNNDNDKETIIYNLISMQGLDINKEDITKAMPLTLQLIEWFLIFQKSI